MNKGRAFPCAAFLGVLIIVLIGGIMTSSSQPALAQNALVLPNNQREMIPVAAFTATGNSDGLKTALSSALDAGLTINELKEIIVQMYAYAGFPRSLNGINAFLEVLNKRKAEGITDQEGREATPHPAAWNSEANGNKTRNELVGADLTNNSAEYARFAPIIDTYLKAHLFGDIFSRDTITHQDRELATISALAAMQGTEGQLAAHYKFSMNTGLSREQLNDFIVVLGKTVGKDAAQRAQKVLEKTLPYSR